MAMKWATVSWMVKDATRMAGEKGVTLTPEEAAEFLEVQKDRLKQAMINSGYLSARSQSS